MSGTRIENPALPVAALALVSGATALAFGRIFSDGGFVPMVLAAALVPHGVGFIGRRRRWSVARTAGTGAAITALVLAWAAAGATTAYGVPVTSTATTLARLVERGWEIFRTGVAPVSPSTGVVLLCAIAMAVCAISADAIARRPGVTLGPLAPSLMLFVLTGTLGTNDLRLTTTSVYVAAALVAIVITNAQRVVARRTWFTGRRLASDAALVRSAALVGGAALLAGLVLTPLIPGVDSPPLLRYRGGNGTGSGSGPGDYSTVSPLVDLRARLTDRSDTELFRVDAPRPLYWRLVALDRFDGSMWSVASEARDAATVFRSRSKRTAVRQQFHIGALGDLWVPAAFSAVGTTLGNARIIPESDTLISPSPISGSKYEVRSAVPEPVTLRQDANSRKSVPDEIKRYLELPDEFPASLHDQAFAITAGAGTPYAAAKALERYFTDGSFTYDLNVDLTDTSEAIGSFLRIRRGFCQQFAGAFAALARSSGLPARVVVGFTPGTVDRETGAYVVRGRDAHAWAEVWLSGLGWRAFEPTPAGPLPGQAVPLDDQSGTTDPNATTNNPATSTTIATPPSTTSNSNAGASRAPRGESLISTQSRGERGWDIRSIGLIVIPAVAIVAAFAVVASRLIGRVLLRRRRHRAPLPAVRITGAWSDALDACTEAGLPVSAALTPQEQARALRAHGAPIDAVAPLRDLADLYAEARFSDQSPAPDADDRAWSAAAELRSALLVGVGPGERTRRVLRSSLGLTTLDGERRAPESSE